MRAASSVLLLAVACAPSEPDRRGAAPADLGPFVAGEVVVKLEPGHGAADVEALATRIGAYAIRPSSVSGWWSLAIDRDRDPREAAEALVARAEIAQAHPNQRRVPFRVPTDRRYPDQWAHQATEAEAGWDIEIGSPDVIVGVIGTGVSIEHSDLTNNIFVNRQEIAGNDADDDMNGLVDDVQGWDFEEMDADPRPTLGAMPSFEQINRAAHETMVAGVIGAAGNNGFGVAGVAWDVSILPIRFDYTTFQSAEAIDYAMRMGARVVNMSYGSEVPGEIARDPFEEETIDRAFLAGVVVVGSSGNSNSGEPHYPAAYRTVLSVGATRRDGERADFSNYGPTVEVSAPGEDVLSTHLGGSFAVSSGTSLSGPYAAGVAALVAAKHPTWTADQIRRTVLYSGDKIYPDFYSGTRVNVRRALSYETPPRAFAHFVTPYASARFPQGGVAVFEGYAIGDRCDLAAQSGSGDWIELATGTSTIGQIARFDTSALALGEYRVRLRCTAGTEVDVDWITVTIAVGALAGWPVLLDAVATSGGISGDLDGDGTPEIIAPVRRGGAAELHAVRADGTALPGWPARLSAPGSAPPALGDLDGDGRLEIVLGTEGGVVAFTAEGQPSVRFAGSAAIEGIALGDLDGDGRLDVVASERGEGGQLWAWRPDGTAYPGWPRTPEPSLGAPAVGDFDGDGFAEIAIVGERRLHLLRASGVDVLGAPLFVEGLPGGSVIAGDIDGDGATELIVARDRHTPGRPELMRRESWNRRLFAFSLDGRNKPGWPFEVERARVAEGERATVSLGDLDGNGNADVLASFDSGDLFAFSGTGAPLPRWPARARSRLFSTSAAGDVDGDGRADLVVVAPASSAVVAFDARARATSGFPLTTSSDGVASPIITDLDADGNVDVVVPGRGLEAFALGQPHDRATLDWPLPRRDSLASGYLPPRFALTIGADGPRDLALSWSAPFTIAPARYVVERDRRAIATVTARAHLDVVDHPDRPHTYRILALDHAGNLLGRSIDVTVTAEARWCDGNDGRACDDGDACTDSDTCRDGACGGGIAAADGTRCDDGDACTIADACSAGRCTSTEVVTCDEGSGCVGSACDPATGACVPMDRADGEACDDHNPCTNDDVCFRRQCRGGDAKIDGVDCDDGNSCTAVGTCRGGVCEGAFPLAAGTECDDGNGCTEPGRCVEDRCEGQIVRQDGTSCDDRDRCTSGDVCAAGVCTAGTAVRCGGDGQCVAGSSCNPRTGECRVRHYPDRAPCDDANACTQWDVCLDGECRGEAPVICSDPTQTCDFTSGFCVSPVEVVEPSGCGCASASGAGDAIGAVFLVLALGLRRGRRSRVETQRPS